jgi:hypothetical protein
MSALWRTAAAAGLLLAAGCSGSARIHLIPAERKKISAQRPLIARYDVSHCHYWVNQRQELCLSFSDENQAAEGTAGRRSFDLSLILGPMPAGRARNYAVDRRTMRAIIHEGAEHRRYGSLFGIVGVWFDEGGEVLHGRFRVWAKQQDYKVWRGWSGDLRVLLVGEFEARPDTGRGERSLERTELGGLKRPLPPGRPVRVYGPPGQAEPLPPQQSRVR